MVTFSMMPSGTPCKYAVSVSLSGSHVGGLGVARGPLAQRFGLLLRGSEAHVQVVRVAPPAAHIVDVACYTAVVEEDHVDGAELVEQEGHVAGPLPGVRGAEIGGLVLDVASHGPDVDVEAGAVPFVGREAASLGEADVADADAEAIGVAVGPLAAHRFDAGDGRRLAPGVLVELVGFPGRTRGRTGVVPARLFVPEPAAGDKTAKPRPLVIALAGAGASANMWFDSYGAGAIVDACRKRGWICVARASAGFDPVTNVDAMMRSIAKRWPVDANRVYLVGHSMGAMKACATAARMPAKFRAVVALGGGGTTGRGEVFRKIAFYVAPGDRDFALAGARALARALERLEQPEIRYRVFEACEHFGIVQVALPNAFRWLDSLE